GLGGKDKFREPLLKVKVIRYAAKQRHRDVGVRIDQAGDDGTAAGIDSIFAAVFRRDLCPSSDGDDLAAAHRNGAVLDHAAVRIHRDYGTTRDDKVDTLGALSTDF